MYTDWESLSSSHIGAARFDAETGTLQVEYSNGSIYEWFGVPQDKYEALLTASSAGKFMNAEITGLYGRGSRVN